MVQTEPQHRTQQRPAIPAQRQRPEAPRLPRTYVARKRLWERLDEVVSDSAVTLLVAPAGAGKTLGVGGWLREAADDGDPRHRAVWVQGDPTWDGEAVAAALDDAAMGVPAPALLVIDDAHRLPPSAIRVLDDRLGEAPDTMRVLLLSRWDLPLSRLVPELLGHFSILRGDVLHMDDDECAALVTAHARTDAPEVIEAITAYARGWCAALVLASRAVASAADPVAAARRYTGNDARVADRLASGVFSALGPRERHLLLCTATEGEVSGSTAAHLSHDEQAGELLADLATTGFLVTRVGDDRADRSPLDVDPTGAAAHEDRYRIHPLLAEVVRRRLVAGGVDVSRARATVLRAVRLDVARGDTGDAFRRLKDMHDLDAAAEQLAADGHSLLAQGQGGAVHTFALHHPQVIDTHPGTWYFLALERWLADDIDAASHWMERVLADADGPADADEEATHVARVATVRLMRGRLGLESLLRAVEHAEAVVAPDVVHLVPRTTLAHLLCELGACQLWLGRLSAAEATLGYAFRTSRDSNMPLYAVSAMTQLATCLYLAGKETAAHTLALGALEVIRRRSPVSSGFSAHRAQLVVQLTQMATLPLPSSPDDLPPLSGPVHASDLTTAFWSRIRDARTHLLRGSVMDAERALQADPGAPDLPDHLRVALTVERGFLAALADDRHGLSGLVGDLDPAVWPGEAALLEGLAADLAGDLRAAADHFATASEAARIIQPPCRALALTAQAQLRDALGEAPAALELLREALTITEVRRNAVPFLGWSRHGTSVHVLLARLHEQSTEPWLAELVAATEGIPSMTTALGPWNATARERTTTSVVVPVLTPRERDVLRELARGATYADIAAQLYVSGNTVKTHVSSLYSKLAATRRSEALATARNLNLL
ncbi:helix-turn-helix transcriptional regulator [Nocardioides sediminis]|uniref:helix-turn-helix transcriptional regulator n=1 Tax=Nocardioides sediminis TaxID=433648 RepID=UPI000D30F83F|nr:LuxR C-terminal-related transcriptional regulator [Nocardioides sediminis]